jgi:hypothetical protein
MLRVDTLEREVVILSGVEGSRDATKINVTGWKAWPRRLSRLRCSLDFAPNDGLAFGAL